MRYVLLGWAAGAIAEPDPAGIARGQALAFASGRGNCLACHAIAGGQQMGDIGPPLADMRARFPDRAALRAQIHDARINNPDTLMPPYGQHELLSADEIEHLIDFLYTR